MKDKKIKLARHLRQQQTSAEAFLWEVLRNRKFENLKFRRQHPLKDYIVDFYCDTLKLAIELDGGYHNAPQQKFDDEQRDFHLHFLGYTVLRYPNEVLISNLEKILTDIKLVKEKRNKDLQNSATFSPLSRRGVGGEGLHLKVLSTKKLAINQRELLLHAGIILVEYNAIETIPIAFEMPKQVENAIFTSQNAVLGFLRKIETSPLPEVRYYCVGGKTKALLEKNGLKVVKTAQNSSELGGFLAKNHKSDTFHYFCGSDRRDELPNRLKSDKISFFEVKTYKTELKPKQFDQKWDAILFFSPSGVTSYYHSNSKAIQTIPKQVQHDDPFHICIGNTTASEAKKYTDKVIIANNTSVESVIAKAVKILK